MRSLGGLDDAPVVPAQVGRAHAEPRDQQQQDADGQPHIVLEEAAVLQFVIAGPVAARVDDLQDQAVRVVVEAGRVGLRRRVPAQQHAAAFARQPELVVQRHVEDSFGNADAAPGEQCRGVHVAPELGRLVLQAQGQAGGKHAYHRVGQLRVSDPFDLAGLGHRRPDRIGAARPFRDRLDHRHEGFARQRLVARIGGHRRHAEADLPAGRHHEDRGCGEIRGGPVAGIEIGQVGADAGKDAVADRTGIFPLAEQREGHGGEAVLAFEKPPGRGIEPGRFADAGGGHQVARVGALGLRAQGVEHALLGVDVADENGEIDPELVFFLLQDALAAPVKGARQDHHERQDAEQRGIHAAGSSRDFS